MRAAKSAKGYVIGLPIADAREIGIAGLAQSLYERTLEKGEKEIRLALVASARSVDWVKSLPKSTVIASCRVPARMAVDYKMPLLLTTTMEEVVGPTITDIQSVAADAFANRFKRGGQLSCFGDPGLREAAKATGRKNMILAGLTTDICLFWAANAARDLGYQITVVADALRHHEHARRQERNH